MSHPSKLANASNSQVPQLIIVAVRELHQGRQREHHWGFSGANSLRYAPQRPQGLAREVRILSLHGHDEGGHGITADVVAAFHFRNRENSGPNTVGPLNLNAPGELRQLHYPALTAEIRVLEFHIVDAKAGFVPSFSSLALLITVKEESADRSGGTP